MNVKAEVLRYFDARAQAPLPGGTEEERLGCKYLDQGIVDSMGLVEMITSFEALFGIRFSSEDVQGYEFQTPGGLIGLIEKRLAEKGTS
ncbi:MAG: acyl carrier protein [Elusimicrobia bacterium]|nr:acyl carrier protein [Elusimicrobiota bacterium]